MPNLNNKTIRIITKWHIAGHKKMFYLSKNPV